MSVNDSTGNLVWPTYQSYTLFNYAIQCVEAVLIIVGNGLTFIAVIKVKNLKQIPTNVFIMSLATSDGIIGLLLPVLVGVKFLDTEHVWKGTTCLLHGPYFSLFLTSLVTLLAIAVDRYLAVVHPLTYKQRMTIRRARIISVVIWILSFGILTTITCYYGLQRNVVLLRSRVVFFVFPKNIAIIFLQILIIGPVLGNIVIYILIYIELKTKRRVGTTRGNNAGANHTVTSKSSKAYVNMMALVLAYLALACVPYYVIAAVLKQGTSTPSWLVYLFDVSVILFYSNSFVNPLIYSWKNRNFREAYKKLMTCRSY